MTPAVPGVEVAHYADAFGVRRPHREQHARHAIRIMQMGTHEAPGMTMPPLAKQVQVVFGNLRRKTVGIEHARGVPGTVAQNELVTLRHYTRAPAPFMHIRAVYALHGKHGVLADDRNLLHSGDQGADQFVAVVGRMPPEQRKRIMLARLDEALEFLVALGGLFHMKFLSLWPEPCVLMQECVYHSRILAGRGNLLFARRVNMRIPYKVRLLLH